MKRNRTSNPPLFDLLRPGGNAWKWTVTYQVASSGYPSSCHVTAIRAVEGEELAGSASCDVALYDDLREVIEFLAVEAMMAACEPTLWESRPHRSVVFTSTF